MLNAIVLLSYAVAAFVLVVVPFLRGRRDPYLLSAEEGGTDACTSVTEPADGEEADA